jgi:hypothetical protein
MSGAEVEPLRAEAEAAEQELEAWVSEQGLLALGRDLYLAGLVARRERAEEARRRLDEALGASAVELPDSAELRTLWPELSTTERRRILAAGIDAVMLRRGRNVPVEQRALVLFGGQAPDDFPRRGRRVPLASFAWPDDGPVAPEPLAEHAEEGLLDAAPRRRGQSGRRARRAHARSPQ